MTTTTKLKWNSELTYHLLQSMKGYRPFGIEKHFHMMSIIEKFQTRTGLKVTADVLWDQIEEFYRIDRLTERDSEKLTKQKPVDYSLPADFK